VSRGGGKYPPVRVSSIASVSLWSCSVVCMSAAITSAPPGRFVNKAAGRCLCEIAPISRLLERLPRTSQTTVAFCRTLVVAHCDPTPVTCGSCSCRMHITNSVTRVSRPPVLDCGTTFHLGTYLRVLQTVSDNSFIWRPKRSFLNV